MIAYHCDRDGCDSWQRIDTDLPTCFLVVSLGEDDIAHVCSTDCLLHWAAQR